MSIGSVPKADEKDSLHPRNLHRERYDFERLIKTTPGLKAFVKLNAYQIESIDFTDAQAVIALNNALLKHFYRVDGWQIPDGYLCPPIPGRADYIHYAADLLAADNNGMIPAGDKIKVLDIGAGANCVYPLIGNSVYQWQFIAADIDPAAIRSAKQIIALNPHIGDGIVYRLQTNAANIFKGVIKQGEVFDLTVCNPPFHSSWQEAQAGNVKKWQQLKSNSAAKSLLNFGGKNTELWCVGGEAAFIRRMVEQSVLFADNVLWFTTLVSKKDTLNSVYKALHKVKAVDVKTINMAQGQKASRIVAWTFLNQAAHLKWRNNYWRGL